MVAVQIEQLLPGGLNFAGVQTLNDGIARVSQKWRRSREARQCICGYLIAIALFQIRNLLCG
ncbi:hypothetical protein EFT87_01940 [Schleiferilactobacillus harbinensis]|nr:hypothetical protein [Schleiferilactobacillus harbinensis]